jgi:hypothetical protein
MLIDRENKVHWELEPLHTTDERTSNFNNLIGGEQKFVNNLIGGEPKFVY